MCRAFSAIVTKDNRVIWKAGVDDHDKLIGMAKLKDDTADPDFIKFARVEITPKAGYLYPEKEWMFKIDENTVPRWWTKQKEQLAWVAFAEWKEQVYSSFNLEEVRNLINPFKLPKREPTKEDLILLKKWDSVRDSVKASVWASVKASVRASVRDSVWDSVGDSVWASVKASGGSVWDSVWYSVWDNVWAYTGSLFPTITKWKYCKFEYTGYPFQPAVDLWKRGLVPSYDGKIWRLHSGKKAEIVYTGE